MNTQQKLYLTEHQIPVVNNLRNGYKDQPSGVCTEWITQLIREDYHILHWCWTIKTDFLLDIAVPE